MNAQAYTKQEGKITTVDRHAETKNLTKQERGKTVFMNNRRNSIEFINYMRIEAHRSREYIKNYNIMHIKVGEGGLCPVRIAQSGICKEKFS